MADFMQGERDREGDTVWKLCDYGKSSPDIKREEEMWEQVLSLAIQCV